jgi:hypothetical protein
MLYDSMKLTIRLSLHQIRLLSCNIKPGKLENNQKRANNKHATRLY